MKRTTVANVPPAPALTFYNSGQSRSRITLITSHGQAESPRQLAGFRLIVFGEEAAAALHQLLHNHSYHELNRLIPGGISSSTWQHMRATRQLQPPETARHGNLEFLNFGHGNSRVLLLHDTSRAPTLTPERIGDTSIIALSGHAIQQFRALLISLPGNTTDAYAAAAAIVPGGLSGGIINRSRRYLAAVRRPSAGRKSNP